MINKKSTMLVAALASVVTIVLSGFLVSHATFGSFTTNTQEDKKMIMTMETLYIFENGTRVHMGPFEIPCHAEEITERGWVVVPDYSVPSL